MGAKNQIKDCKGNYHKPKLKLAHFIDVNVSVSYKITILISKYICIKIIKQHLQSVNITHLLQIQNGGF